MQHVHTIAQCTHINLCWLHTVLMRAKYSVMYVAPCKVYTCKRFMLLMHMLLNPTSTCNVTCQRSVLRSFVGSLASAVRAAGNDRDGSAYAYAYPRLRARAGAQSDRGVRFMRERERTKRLLELQYQRNSQAKFTASKLKQVWGEVTHTHTHMHTHTHTHTELAPLQYKVHTCIKTQVNEQFRKGI